MRNLWQQKIKQAWTGMSRRDLFRRGGILAAAQAAGIRPQAAAAPLELGADMYRSIGVRPIINARGTFTIITGSQTLPEVKRAMDLASRSFVHMDELMDAVGQRLAELTGAEWGIVSAGCCAGVTHCTTAAVAGGNPERMQRLPDLAGLKDEVVIPAYSRNVYDHAVRMVGCKLVVSTSHRNWSAPSTNALPWCTFWRGRMTMVLSGRARSPALHARRMCRW
jgi:D-glucosaminate-6-phosphate ammonia-lyase